MLKLNQNGVMNLESTFIKDTGKYGRGVFADRLIKKGELIEQCPVIVIPMMERYYLDMTEVGNYYFNWGKDYNDVAIALGYGSLYNHSYFPSASFSNNLENLSINFYAIKDIQQGEEITVNYHGNPEDKSPLWFDVLT
ncbi:TPA: SET domain-containing protein-lysine N-methyltransferase [Bacillus tropicus]|nr:SET domain-containing protein-lysine N-methyltransferase [Bacillus tropicus]